MESLDTSGSNSPMPVRQMFNLPPPHSTYPPPPFGLDDDQKPVVRGEGRGC